MPLRVNLRDGTTRSFELLDEREESAWGKLQADSHFQRTISGLALARNGGAQHFLPVPRAFSRLLFQAHLERGRDGAPVALCASCTADDVKVSLMLYLETGSTRVDIRQVGRIVHSPAGVPQPRDGR